MLRKILIMGILVIISLSALNMALASDPLDPDNANRDMDNDGISDLEEFLAGSDPNNADSDNDGLNDGWEFFNDMDPSDPTDAHDDLDYIAEDGGPFNGEIDSQFNAIINSFDVWPSDQTTRFDADKHYDNYEEYYRKSEWIPNDQGLLIKTELYVARTEPWLPDTDNDGKLDPDDAAPTIFDNDGAVFSDEAGAAVYGTAAYDLKIKSVDSLSRITDHNSILLDPNLIASLKL